MRNQAVSRRVNAIDRHVGQRLRDALELRGMTVDDLSKSLGISSEEVERLCSGELRIGAARLYDLRTVLQVETSWFFSTNQSTGR